MSTRVLRRTRDPIELLERMLNNTTLYTQRVTHGNIIGLGQKQLNTTHIDIDSEKEKAVKEALEASDRRHTKELRAALRRQDRELEEERNRALERQKIYYVDLAERVSRQRDQAEEQRMRELRRKLDKEKAAALKKQFEELQESRQQAIDEACDALRVRLRNDFALEKEKAIADALANAREKFRIREQATIERTRRECEKEAAEEAARVAKQHDEELQRQAQRYAILHRKYEKELQHKLKVEDDFQALQTDYQRFMDYTDGKYHSNYMMQLRHHGLDLSRKRLSVVTYEDIEELL